MAPIKQLLSSKYAVGLCFILAFFSKVLLTHYFFSFDADKMHQALATQSLLQGYNVSLPVVHAANLSLVKHEPLIGWPPGYTLLIAPLYLITNNLQLSSFILGILGYAAFLFIYVLLLYRIGFTNQIICLLLLFTGVFITDEIVASSATDIITLTLLLSLCYISIGIIKQQKIALKQALLLGVFCFAPALFRFMYLPITPIIPACILVIGWQYRIKSLIRGGVVSLIASLLLIALFLFYQKATTGYFLYPDKTYAPAVIPLQKGYYWNNLLKLYPIVFGSFINLDFLLQLGSKITGYVYTDLLKALAFLNIATLIILITWLTRKYLKQEKRTFSYWSLFFFITYVLGIAILLFLCYMSVSNSSQFPPPHVTRWTYVQQARYFNLLMVCLPIYSFYYLFIFKTDKSTFTRRILQIVLITIISFEILHGGYFIIKRTFPWNRHAIAKRQEETFESFIKQFINANQQKGLNVVITSSNITYTGYGILYKASSLYQSLEINDVLFTEKPTVLLLIADKDSLKYYYPFLKKEKVKQFHQIDNTFFYALYMNANEVQ